MAKVYAREAGASMTDDLYLGTVQGETQDIATQLQKSLPKTKVICYGNDVVIEGNPKTVNN